MVTQLGLCVVTPVLLCVFLGYQLSPEFGRWIILPLLILGVLGGGRGAWMMAQRTLADEQKEDERLQAEQRASRKAREGISRPKRPGRIHSADDTGKQKEAD